MIKIILFSYDFVDQNENMTKIPVIALFLPTCSHILEMSRKMEQIKQN